MGFFGPPDVEKMEARKNVKGLIKALGYRKCSLVQEAAARVLGEIGDPRAVEPLISALKDKVWVVRGLAAEALGKLGDSRAVEPLINALKDEDLDVRGAAAEALGKLGDSRAVEPLISALKDKESYVLIEYGEERRKTNVCRAVVHALGKLRDPRAVDPLIKTLKNKDSFLREEAAKALSKLRWKPDNREDEVWYWIGKDNWDKVIFLGTEAVEPLINALKDKDWDVREAVAEALGKSGSTALGDSRAVEPLINALKHEHWRVREAAAEALGNLGDSRAVEPLINALKDEDYGVQEIAAEALGKIGDPRVVKPLIKALKDNYLWLSSHPEANYDDNYDDIENKWHDSRLAAKVLVNIYHQGTLDEESKKSILAVRDIITYPRKHWHSDSDCGGLHFDAGIGVDFPL